MVTTTTAFPLHLDLPPRFYEDHIDRDLPGGVAFKLTRKLVSIEIDEDELAELLSDAHHYSSFAQNGSEYLGLQSSARATVKRITKALAAVGITVSRGAYYNPPTWEGASDFDSRSLDEQRQRKSLTTSAFARLWCLLERPQLERPGTEAWVAAEITRATWRSEGQAQCQECGKWVSSPETLMGGRCGNCSVPGLSNLLRLG